MTDDIHDADDAGGEDESSTPPGSRLPLIQQPGLLQRFAPVALKTPAVPAGHLALLRPRERWEVVRRHPIYTTFWRWAAQAVDGSGSADDEVVRHIRRYGHVALSKVGVVGGVADPALRWAEVESWMALAVTGPVRLATARDMAVGLMTGLPAEARAEVGRLLLQSATGSAGMPVEVAQAEALDRLLRSSTPELDAARNLPVVILDPSASLASLKQEVVTFVKDWKRRRGFVKQLKRKPTDVANQIAAWDLREGWSGGEYRPETAWKFEVVAAELKLDLQTCHSRYKAAFELISGRPFTPEAWWTLMTPFLLAALGPGAARPSSEARRPASGKTVRGRSAGTAAATPDPPRESTVGSAQDVPELIEEIRAMFAAGASPQEVSDRLKGRGGEGLDDEQVEMVRRRIAELGEF